MSPLIGVIVHPARRVKLDGVRVTGVSTPTRPFEENEDWLGSGPGLVVVLDGCGAGDTLAEEVDRHCVHGLPWYVKTLGTALLRGGTDPATPLDDALATAIAETASAHHGRCDLRHPLTPAANVAALRVNRMTVEYLVLSAATVLLDDGSGEPIVVTDDRLSRLDLPAHGDSAHGGDRHREISAERLRLIGAARNRPDGYPVAAAEPQAAYQAVTGHLDRHRLRRALLATAGATRLVDLFGELTWPQLLDLAAERGPDEVVSRTRRAEDTDPDCTGWPRDTVHEDATVVYCSFEP